MIMIGGNIMNVNDVILNTGKLTSAHIEAFNKTVNKEVQNHPESDADRISHIIFAYFAIKEALKFKKDIRVSYDIGGISPCMGVVSISGKTIIFNNANLFKDAKNLATNFEVYPKIDGTIQMNFGFHGLKRKDGNN